MKNRWHRLSSGRPESEGPPSATLLREQPPLLRLRADRDGGRSRTRPPRRWSQPLPLAGALLILLALLGYWTVYNQTTKRTQVLVAAHALQAGGTLRASDLQTARIAGSRSVLASFLPASERALVAGRTLKAPVAAGAPIPAAALAAPGRRAASFTLVLPLMHALGGDLAPGDRVTVLATYTATNGQSTTRVIARALPVISVGQASGFNVGAQTIPVTVALPDPSLASALALANEAAKLDLLREGGGGSAPIPPASSPGGTP